jgi:hypothetical protein
MEVSIAEDRIRFRRYDFPGATVYPSGTLAPEQIRDADWAAWPPEIRTMGGETLFVSHDQREELEQFCHRNGIARKCRADIWSDLLEPFLDTTFDRKYELATENRLSAAGFTAAEIGDIRARIAPLMEAYNFDSMLWEWVHLGLFDLLQARTGPLVKPAVRAAYGDPAAFYAWAMDIAERRR